MPCPSHKLHSSSCLWFKFGILKKVIPKRHYYGAYGQTLNPTPRSQNPPLVEAALLKRLGAKFGRTPRLGEPCLGLIWVLGLRFRTSFELLVFESSGFKVPCCRICALRWMVRGRVLLHGTYGGPRAPPSYTAQEHGPAQLQTQEGIPKPPPKILQKRCQSPIQIRSTI